MSSVVACRRGSGFLLSLLGCQPARIKRRVKGGPPARSSRPLYAAIVRATSRPQAAIKRFAETRSQLRHGAVQGIGDMPQQALFVRKTGRDFAAKRQGVYHLALLATFVLHLFHAA